MANPALRPYDTFVSLLDARASATPDAPAFTFLPDGEAEGPRWTYADLAARAGAIATALRESTSPGDRALLVYPPGLDFLAAFFGCLCAGVVAVPAYPPEPARLARTLPRLRAIVADAHPSAVLTTGLVRAAADLVAAQAPELAVPPWLATDELAPIAPAGVRAAVAPDDVAFLQYTSGSTGTPRGVMVSHRNLLENIRLIVRGYGLREDDEVFVGWLPVYHDMGLIANLLTSVRLGVPCVLMSPADFLRRPMRWLRAIDRYRGTTSGGPNFAYDLCVRRSTPEERASLDLSSWRVAFNGAEPVRASTLRRFADAFAPARFRADAFSPSYGLAETTLYVSGGTKQGPPRELALDADALARGRARPAAPADPRPRVVVSCGLVIDPGRVAIVDVERRVEVEPGAVGEIWVRGPSVARGYWALEAETEATFGALLADGRGPFLRTGDLGFLHEGELYVSGRVKDVIVVRGVCHYPQDIEATAEGVSELLRRGSAVAFPFEGGDEERVGVVVELERAAEGSLAEELEALAARVREAVVETHDLRVDVVAFARAGAVPKTSSGKLQRRGCREALLKNELDEIYRSAL